MRIPAASLGIGIAVFLAAATSQSQTLPHAGADAIDQPVPDSSLLPAGGLTLDVPNGLEQPGRETENQLRPPSDGLGLRIYDSGRAMPSSDNEREPENLGVNPVHRP